MAADAVLFVHLVFVLFVVFFFVLIPTGAVLGWRWVRSRPLRAAHLVAIALVAAEAVAGIACPLTVWEDLLRRQSQAMPFVPRLLHAVLYYDLPPWVFTTAYVAAAALALLLWWLVPPRKAP